MTEHCEPHEIARGRCAAGRGDIADIDAADFTFVAEDGHHDRNGQPTMTKAFGYFTVTDEERGHDTFRTGSFETPAGSPVSRAAHQAAADAALQAHIAAILRENVGRCLCTDVGTCPALDPDHLLLALCRATRGHSATSAAPAPGPSRTSTPTSSSRKRPWPGPRHGRRGRAGTGRPTSSSPSSKAWDYAARSPPVNTAARASLATADIITGFLGFPPNRGGLLIAPLLL